MVHNITLWLLILWCSLINGDEDEPALNKLSFRMQKFNFAWEKAQLRLDEAEAEDFFLEMTKLDKDALKAKHEFSNGKDPSGKSLDTTDKKFENLLKQYKLYDVLASLHDRKSPDNDNKRIKEKFQSKNSGFSDSSLNKLWHDAKVSGFSENELDDLYLEFQHYEKKREKFQQFEKEINSAAEDHNSISNEIRVETNEIDDTNSHEDKNKKLKSLYKEADRHYAFLVDKIENEKIRSADGNFTHPKVKKLWENALKMGGKFSEDELNALMEELKHFDIKLSKLAFVEDELLKNKYKNQKLEKNKDHLKSLEQKELEVKLKDYERKVDKIEKYLKSKLVHTEL